MSILQSIFKSIIVLLDILKSFWGSPLPSCVRALRVCCCHSGMVSLIFPCLHFGRHASFKDKHIWCLRSIFSLTIFPRSQGSTVQQKVLQTSTASSANCLALWQDSGKFGCEKSKVSVLLVNHHIATQITQDQNFHWKIFLYMFAGLSECTSCVGRYLRRMEEIVRTPGTRFIGGCEPVDVRAGLLQEQQVL